MTAASLPASGLALIAANCLPLLGVMFAGWEVFNVVLLYWLETAVIGVVNVLRILTAQGSMADMGQRMLERRGVQLGADQIEQLELAAQQLKSLPAGFGGGMKLFLVPFFCLHFGIFMVVHLAFIAGLLGSRGGISGGSPFAAAERVFSSFTPLMVLTVLALLASHIFSFFVNWIGRGEYRASSPPEQMMRPYARVVVMHIAILFGAFATMMFGGGIVILLLLIAGKIVIDLKLHMREHRLAQAKLAATPAQ